MKTNWGAAFNIVAVYVGTVVGAGFATGREIVEFFSRFGIYGLIGVFMAGYILTYMGAKLMRIAAAIGAQSYEEMNVHLFGKFFGRIINIVMLFMLLGVCAVMLSGAGAVFEEAWIDKVTGNINHDYIVTSCYGCRFKRCLCC